MTPEALAALHAQCFDHTPRPWSAGEFAALLAQDTAVLVHRPEGFALGRSTKAEAELLTLAVAPAAQRLGHATMLVEAFEAEAVMRGARQIFLEVAETNLAARSLYVRLGYAEAGRRRGYYRCVSQPPVDGLVLRKAVGPAEPTQASGRDFAGPPGKTI